MKISLIFSLTGAKKVPARENKTTLFQLGCEKMGGERERVRK